MYVRQVAQTSESSHGAGPAEEVEEPGDDAGGEAPQDQVLVVADQEGRADPARRVPHRDPVRRGRAAPRSGPGRRVHLVGVDHARPARRLAPPAEHRASPRSCSAAATARAARRTPRRPAGSRPVSSSASRSAASRGGSPGSIEPPGKDTWPGWERMSWARSVSSRSGPPGALAEEHQHGALRGSRVLGRHEAGSGRRRVIVAGAARTGSSQAGSGRGWSERSPRGTAGRHSRIPRCCAPGRRSSARTRPYPGPRSWCRPRRRTR